MKEKRYLCSWWDNKESSYKLKLKLIFIAIVGLIVLSICYMSGIFSFPSYQEEKFDELEQLYPPYIHEGVGIDIVGLSKVATVSSEPLNVYNDEITLEYKQDDYSVTLHLDNNYNV